MTGAVDYRAAPATFATLALTVAATLFAWTMWPQAAVLGGFIPARLGGASLAGAVPALLTPFTAALMHSSWMHLAFNMLMLVWVGRAVEGAIGAKLWLGLYVLGAVFGAVGSWALHPASTIPGIGASGAISALVAVYALVFSEREVKSVAGLPPHFVRALWLGAAWIGIQLLVGYASDNIDIGAHIGGFVAGLVLARPLLRLRFRR